MHHIVHWVAEVREQKERLLQKVGGDREGGCPRSPKQRNQANLRGEDREPQQTRIDTIEPSLLIRPGGVREDTLAHLVPLSV